MAKAAIEPDSAIKTKTSNPLKELRLSAIGTMVNQSRPAWCGMLTPRSAFVTGASASIKMPGNTPAARHRADRKNIAASELLSVSSALAAAGVRGRPRKLMPNAFTKQAAANAADNANKAPTAGTRNLRPQDGN